MIVGTMSEKELIAEMAEDTERILLFVRGKKAKLRRVYITNKKYPLNIWVDYFSPRKNKWLIQIYAESKKQGLEKPFLRFVAITNTTQGFFAITPYLITPKLKTHHVYASHFFSRYASRCNINLNGVELIKHYFERNTVLEFQQGDEAKREVVGVTTEGVALGVMTDGGNLLFKTFITHDMKKGSQVEKFIIKGDSYASDISDEQVMELKKFLGIDPRYYSNVL